MSKRRPDLPRQSLGTAFATRIAEEQEARGWSDAGLAKRASVFYPMSAATIWKIKRAQPPRRVDIDEADAIVRACGAANLEEFLQNAEYRRLQSEILHVSEALSQAKRDVHEIRKRLKHLARRRPASVWREVRSAQDADFPGAVSLLMDAAEELASDVAAAVGEGRRTAAMFEERIGGAE